MYPVAINVANIGSYPPIVNIGGGYRYDDVLEYRVWFNISRIPQFVAFINYESAHNFKCFLKQYTQNIHTVALVRQKWYYRCIDDKFTPLLGDTIYKFPNDEKRYIKVEKIRLTEYKIQWLLEKIEPESSFIVNNLNSDV
jgi:hypothetical protein